MARRFDFESSFSTGEIAPELLLRADLAPRNEALKTARNIHLLQGGGFRRRHGSLDVAAMPDDAVIKTLGLGLSNLTLLAFLPGKFRHTNLDGSLIQQITGCPWGSGDLRTMQIAVSPDEIIVTSQSFWPQQLARPLGGSWTRADFAFLPGLNGSTRQPYWRYADPGVSLAPSAYTGSITLTASNPVFSAAYVGTRLRYVGIEISITAYTDTTHLTGTVVGNLYPTIAITVVDSTGFIVGQEVQGEDSQVTGVVAAVPDATHVDVLLINGYAYPNTTEKLVGPTAVTAITAVGLIGTPAVTSQWDEQMISAVHGYPGSCAFHRTRLLLGDFPNAKNGFAASAIGEINDFDVGTGLDSDAISETVGRDASLDIKHFGSTEQLIMLTEAGSFYIPEQVSAPLSPTNIDVLKIGPEAVGTPQPVLVSEGLLFTEAVSGRVMGAIPTGNVRRSWEIADLSELAFHMMGTPVALELIPANSESDRLLFNLRDDGKFAVMAYRRSGQSTAWALWDTMGLWRSMTNAGGDLFTVVQRTIAGTPVYRLEKVSSSVYGDGVVSMPGGDLSHLNGQVCTVWTTAGAYVGPFTITAGAVVGLPPEITTYKVGFDFTLEAETVPPVDPNTGIARRSRFPRVYLDVVGTLGVRINGFAPAGYINGDGTIGGTIGGEVAPLTGQLLFYTLGHARVQGLKITQTEGGPLQVRTITAEVTT